MINEQIIQVETSHTICAAHRLLNHPGKCARIHGHNYKITYTLIRHNFDFMGDGMVLDFSEIKKNVCQYVDAIMDHKIILQETDPLVQILANSLGEEEFKNQVFIMNARPTAEVMAASILFNVQEQLNKLCDGKITVGSVKVEETPGNAATANNILFSED